MVCTALTAAPPAYAAFSAAVPTPANSFAALDSFPCLTPALPDNPYLFYAFNEASGTVTADASVNKRSGTLHGATRVPGTCITGAGPALSLSGTPGYVSTPTKLPAPNTFTLEIWFKTGIWEGKGGRLIGFGNLQSGTSTTADRHLYMTNQGKIAFSMGGKTAIISRDSYNDGIWHHATVTMVPHIPGVSTSLISLYIDGGKWKGSESNFSSGYAYDGFWRVGYDTMPLSNGNDGSTSAYFAGSVDNAAVYHAPLNATQVQAHYDANH